MITTDRDVKEVDPVNEGPADNTEPLGGLPDKVPHFRHDEGEDGGLEDVAD